MARPRTRDETRGGTARRRRRQVHGRISACGRHQQPTGLGIDWSTRPCNHRRRTGAPTRPTNVRRLPAGRRGRRAARTTQHRVNTSRSATPRHELLNWTEHGCVNACERTRTNARSNQRLGEVRLRANVSCTARPGSPTRAAPRTVLTDPLQTRPIGGGSAQNSDARCTRTHGPFLDIRSDP